ncbi:hypothetical protein JHW43_000559 [Diplocarpon mali]|nr:hypothetical protein JHW43_000559 [Diplocarpon mali]
MECCRGILRGRVAGSLGGKRRKHCKRRATGEPGGRDTNQNMFPPDSMHVMIMGRATGGMVAPTVPDLSARGYHRISHPAARPTMRMTSSRRPGSGQSSSADDRLPPRSAPYPHPLAALPYPHFGFGLHRASLLIMPISGLYPSILASDSSAPPLSRAQRAPVQREIKRQRAKTRGRRQASCPDSPAPDLPVDSSAFLLFRVARARRVCCRDLAPHSQAPGPFTDWVGQTSEAWDGQDRTGPDRRGETRGEEGRGAGRRREEKRGEPRRGEERRGEPSRAEERTRRDPKSRTAKLAESSERRRLFSLFRASSSSSGRFSQPVALARLGTWSQSGVLASPSGRAIPFIPPTSPSRLFNSDQPRTLASLHIPAQLSIPSGHGHGSPKSKIQTSKPSTSPTTRHVRRVPSHPIAETPDPTCAVPVRLGKLVSLPSTCLFIHLHLSPDHPVHAHPPSRSSNSGAPSLSSNSVHRPAIDNERVRAHHRIPRPAFPALGAPPR